MTPTTINIFLQAVGLSTAEAAEQIGCSLADLSKTINGHQKNHAIRKKFCARFNLDVETVFGSDFDQAVSAAKSKREKGKAA